jgi:hypothetical protein
MRRTLAFIVGILSAALFGQFPEYAQQYEQRLGGAVDELRIIAADFDRAAESAGLTRQAALERYGATGDEFVAGRGVAMARVFLRLEELSATLAEVSGASGWERFRNLPRYLDTEIGGRTLEAYRPAVPVTVEGVAYAGAGLLLGYLFASGLIRFVLLPFRRRPRPVGT